MSTYTVGQVGLIICGAYDNDATYNKLDVVSYKGSSFVAIADTTGNPPTDTTRWKQLAQGYDDAPDATECTLDNGSAPDSNFGNGNLRYRVIGKHVYISGGVNARYTGSTLNLATLPENARPKDGTVFSLRPCSGSRIARINVTSAGVLGLSWIKNISDASNYTTDAIWIDCNFDYWID